MLRFKENKTEHTVPMSSLKVGEIGAVVGTDEVVTRVKIPLLWTGGESYPDLFQVLGEAGCYKHDCHRSCKILKPGAILEVVDD